MTHNVPRETVGNTTFSERLAYARFVYHFRTGKTAGNAEIGRAAGRTGPWVTKWAESSTPPTDFNVHEPLAAFLGVEEEWLVRGRGEPPEPTLWTQWLAKRRKEPDPFASDDMGVPEHPSTREFTEEEAQIEEKPAKGRAVGGTKKGRRDR